jgi:anti-sigma factor RsiW
MARNKTLSNEQIDALEAHLAGILRPVTPPSEVVQRLRERVRSSPAQEIVSRLRGDWQRMFVVLGGVLSGMLVMITVARAFYYLVGRRHL